MEQWATPVLLMFGLLVLVLLQRISSQLERLDEKISDLFQREGVDGDASDDD